MQNKTSHADNATAELRDEALLYFTRYLPEEQRGRGRNVLKNIIDRYGPCVTSYPHWHPLVASGDIDRSSPATRPTSGRCGYRGLDHTRFLRNAIITCPYYDKLVFESVEALNPPPIVKITAEPIGAPLYHPKAKPILITCEWDGGLQDDGTIPASLAVPLLLEVELPCWRDSQVSETWKTMKPYILGISRSNRSSPFVNTETGQMLKSLWNTLIKTGMFGPIRVG